MVGKVAKIEISRIEGAWQTDEGFPQPDWKIIGDAIRRDYPDEKERAAAWQEAVQQWAGIIQYALGRETYSLYQSKRTLIVTAKSGFAARGLLGICDAAVKQIQYRLGKLVCDMTVWKPVVFFFDDLDVYYRYISHFYSEGREHVQNGGIFLPRGYPHVAIPPGQRYQRPDETVVHELTHFGLRKLHLPRWLNEGLAVAMESEVLGSRISQTDIERLKETQVHWNAENIQGFWRGDSFMNSEETRESYLTARVLVQNVWKEFPEFQEFVRDASPADGGEASALKYLGISLSDVAASFLGEGDWTPKLPAAEPADAPGAEM